ncbi:MAG: ABC transporter permease [Nitrospirae bacterium]|nr:ABC transporter permease [Nitrospirota bacterium]
MIELSHVSKTYRMGEIAVPALRDVSLTIEQGEFIAIMGPSGSGKSTLMHMLGLLDVPDAGSYRLFGTEVARRNEDELAALRARVFGFVFQQFHLLPRTTALENVMLPLLYDDGPRDDDRAKRRLEEVGLGERLRHRPNELSGGQQQRVAIARALIRNPPIVLADEPTGNLDSASEHEIMQLFSRLHEQGITVILVTHEADIAKYAHRIIRMRDGAIQSDEAVKGRAPRTAPVAIAEQERAGVLQRKRPVVSLHAFGGHLRQAGRALLANKVRSGLSMLGILIGVAAVIAVLALGEGARAAIQARLSSMGSNLLVLRPGSQQMGGVSLAAGAVTRLTLEDADAILADVPGISKVAPSVSGRGQAVFGNKNWNTQIIGTTPSYALIRASEPLVGRFFTDEENTKRARVAVIGLTTTRELFGEANPIGEFIKINKINFQIIGLLPEKGATPFRDQDDVIVIPIATGMRRLMGQDYVESIDIEVAAPDLMESAQDEVTALMIRRHRVPPTQQEPFQIRNMAEIQAAISETNRTMAWLLAAIAVISLLVGGIGIMNIMLVSVTERTREIGLRKAIGARRQDVLAQFLVEALAISLMGGAIGIALGWGASLAMVELAGWAATVSWNAALLAFFFAAAVGVIFGLWPARKASLLSPIEAMRYE